MTAPATMKAALSTLTAATTRARRSAPAQTCTAVKTGEIDGDMEAAARSKERPERHWACRRYDRRSGPAEIEREKAEENRGDQRRQQHDAAGCEPGRKARADRDRDRKDGQKERHHFFAATDREGDQRRQ